MARTKTAFVRIYNKSKQLIPLQVRPPKTDFYLNEQQVRLRPGKHVSLPQSHLSMDQITNLQARQMITVRYDDKS